MESPSEMVAAAMLLLRDIAPSRLLFLVKQVRSSLHGPCPGSRVPAEAM
jgi:hypothetical protein